MKYDFNALENTAKHLIDWGRHRDAAKIYLFMADGDTSLDGGYLSEKLGECYEALGDFDAATYWYGRAVEENPAVRIAAADARKRLESIVTDGLRTLIRA